MVSEGSAWKIIHFKLRGLLYNEIVELEKLPNFKSSRILGFCLNVMGLTLRKKTGSDMAEYAIHKAVLSWTQKNYLRLCQVHPEFAEDCLLGSISFDKQEKRLVKTYAKGLSLEEPKEYLDLIG